MPAYYVAVRLELRNQNPNASGGFYERQLYRQVLLRACISYGNSVSLSVCLSVCPSVTTRYGFNDR